MLYFCLEIGGFINRYKVGHTLLLSAVQCSTTKTPPASFHLALSKLGVLQRFGNSQRLEFLLCMGVRLLVDSADEHSSILQCILVRIFTRENTENAKCCIKSPDLLI